MALVLVVVMLGLVGVLGAAAWTTTRAARLEEIRRFPTPTLAMWSSRLAAVKAMANAQTEAGRALRLLPPEVDRELQAWRSRRAGLVAGVLMGATMFFGVAAAWLRTQERVMAVLVVGLMLMSGGMLAWLYLPRVGFLMRKAWLGASAPPVLVDLGAFPHDLYRFGHRAFRVWFSALSALVVGLTAPFVGRPDLGLGFLALSVSCLVLLAAGPGRVELGAESLRYGFRRWRWAEFDRVAWTDDGAHVALRRRSPGTYGEPWLHFSVPEDRREAARALLDEVLGATSVGEEGARPMD